MWLTIVGILVSVSLVVATGAIGFAFHSIQRIAKLEAIQPKEGSDRLVKLENKVEFLYERIRFTIVGNNLSNPKPNDILDNLANRFLQKIITRSELTELVRLLEKKKSEGSVAEAVKAENFLKLIEWEMQVN